MTGVVDFLNSNGNQYARLRNVSISTGKAMFEDGYAWFNNFATPTGANSLCAIPLVIYGIKLNINDVA